MRSSATILAVTLLLIEANPVCADGPEAAVAKHPDGIWKAAQPRHAMKGELDNHDPIGLAAGVAIKTDCSLNWVDPDDHKLYCFNSATSVEYFRQWPKANIRRARASWEAMRSTPIGPTQ